MLVHQRVFGFYPQWYRAPWKNRIHHWHPLANGNQGSLPALAAKKGVKVDSTRDLEAVLPTKVEIEDPHVGGLKPNKPPFWFFKISLRPRKHAIFS